MNDLLTYIDEYQHTPFTLSPINEVDILIINELTYLPYCDTHINRDITIEAPLYLTELADRYQIDQEKIAKENPFLATKDRNLLLQSVSKAPRYQNIKVAHYTNIIEEQNELQFCAMTYLLSDQTFLVSYRGTDDTLIGWKEDFNLTFLDTLPAQELAEQYLDHIIEEHHDKDLLIAGHSKGGNLAYYAALNLFPKMKHNLRGVYLFDSPGLNREVLDKAYFKELSDRVYRYIPEDSIVGRILDTDIPPIIVKSSSFSVLQHIITNWHIEQNQLIRLSETTDTSDILDKTLKDWCALYSKKELEEYFEYLYQSILNLGIHSLNDLSSNFISLLSQILTSNAYGTKEEQDKYHQYSWKLVELWRKNRKDLNKTKLQSVQETLSQHLSSIPQRLTKPNNQTVISLNRTQNQDS